MTSKWIPKSVLVAASCFCVAAATSGPATAGSQDRLFHYSSSSVDNLDSTQSGDLMLFAENVRGEQVDPDTFLRDLLKKYGTSDLVIVPGSEEFAAQGRDVHLPPGPDDFGDFGSGPDFILGEPFVFPGDDYFDLYLKLDLGDGDVVINGRDYAVESVPLPGAIVLMASAVAAPLGFSRVRFRRRGAPNV